jgi:hypothetical protein
LKKEKDCASLKSSGISITSSPSREISRAPRRFTSSSSPVKEEGVEEEEALNKPARGST